MLLLAVTAVVVPCSTMNGLALRHGGSEWRAVSFPLSMGGWWWGVSMMLLSDGREGDTLPWALLITSSGAFLAAHLDHRFHHVIEDSPRLA
ncbi:hypothetical protein [Nocardiopsis alborubida]|uniref:hypothetical protein n=1 Tax=Nocardiopsis TaxID=2013 RepID=UPI00076E345D